jgi:hypothetical protein
LGSGVSVKIEEMLKAIEERVIGAQMVFLCFHNPKLCTMDIGLVIDNVAYIPAIDRQLDENLKDILPCGLYVNFRYFTEI